MIGRTNTGGGGGLNFQVIGGTTAPSNPKENMIWVNTSTKITSYIFSATQPTGSAGMVWISTGTYSTVEFNALKKNGIQVYPISAKQYVGGVWAPRNAEIYHAGEWLPLSAIPIYFFKDGKVDVEYVKKGTVSIGTDKVTITASNKKVAYVICGPVSLTGYKSIKMTYDYVSGDALSSLYATVFVAHENNVTHGKNAIACARRSFRKGDGQAVELDISTVSGLDSVYVYYGLDHEEDLYDRKIAVTEVICQ